MEESQIPGTRCDLFYLKSNGLFAESVVHKSATSLSEARRLPKVRYGQFFVNCFVFDAETVVPADNRE